MKVIWSAIAVGMGLASATTGFGQLSLQSAKVSEIQQSVTYREASHAAPRPAKVGDEIRDDRAILTGAKSRAELTFNDHSIARLGPNSQFSFHPASR
ncbi:MAG: hypothetical protein JO317_06110, partial [Verrucomicrobiae bacterium]|nr:hypothetical protein [Verrucomicrobiae bacterium]